MARILSVRKNLLDTLMRLKHILDKPIWINAMTINQDDVEKMHQIRLMTDIYRSAKIVLVSTK
jgi:hypothetical protein